MASKGCVLRLQKELKALQREPVPHLTAQPNPSNILEWNFVLEGAVGTDYEGGVYHGKLVFPPTYPFKPPSISMVTPNGRFAVNTKLCLSMTDYHPESWNPMWSCSSILTGLMSFMHDSAPTTGSVTTTSEEKRRLARDSLAFNCRSAAFRRVFPEWVGEHERRQAAEAAAAAAGGDGEQHGGPQDGEQQQQQHAQGRRQNQQQQGDAARPRPEARGGGPAAAAAAPPAAASGAFAAAVVVLVLAIAVLPLCSPDIRDSLAALRSRLFPGP